MSATAAKVESTATSPSFVTKLDRGSPLLFLAGAALAIKAGTLFALSTGTVEMKENTGIDFADGVPGDDYIVLLNADGTTRVLPAVDREIGNHSFIGGFHFAPGGNASARAGGDVVPAINPFSIHDNEFRPSCDDVSSMTAVRVGQHIIWADIYHLNVEHLANGTSRFGATIADGRNLPQRVDGSGVYSQLDYKTSGEILTHHGKRHMTPEEAFAAFYGVTERTAAPKRSEVAGLDVPRTSKYGVMMATGQRWVWGNDGDPDEPRASVFGGSWLSGGGAGSRCAGLGCWPGNSRSGLGARGVCDHLQLG